MYMEVHYLLFYSFTFQIYCDFSGYSDIAIGVAKYGIKLSQNFKYPYFSRNIGDFGRGAYFLVIVVQNYVYIPLGGSKRGNLLAVKYFLLLFDKRFLAWGNWTFIIWGFVHSLLYPFVFI